MKKEDIRSGVAEILRSLREKQGYSKNRMAERLGINKRTWYAWESGESSPNIVDFINIFTELGEPMMRPILQLLYGNQPAADDIETLRQRTADFFHRSAPDHMVQVWSFLNSGEHGSNVAPQVEEFCALDHLPLEHRYYVGEMIYMLYKTAAHRGELVATDEVMPNMEVWEAGLKSGQKAAFNKLKSYTTITEEK